MIFFIGMWICSEKVVFMVFLSNNYLYHYVIVITMCFMFHQRLPRCLQQSAKKGKPTSSYSTSANVIYDVGVSTSGESVLVVLTVGVVVSNSVVCIWCTFSLVLLLINVLHRYLIVYWQEDRNTLKQVVQPGILLWAILFSTQEYNRRYLYIQMNYSITDQKHNKSIVLEYWQQSYSLYTLNGFPS
jgi:hypothetical protein